MKSTASIFQTTDYRSFLRETLASMKERNSQFSMRALARKLETPVSFLSEVLNGKKNLSLEKALQIGRLLDLKVKETTYLCYLVAVDTCSDPAQKASLLQELEFFQHHKGRLSLDIKNFEVISQWECIAIFELLNIYPRQTVEFYSSQLNISKAQIERALASLQALNLIHITDLGPEKTGEEIFISSQHHHLALKMYHSSMLEKARHALYEQSPATRYTGTETLMIDPKLLPDAHQILNECLDRLLVLFKQSNQKSSLVHVHVNMFELNKKKAIS